MVTLLRGRGWDFWVTWLIKRLLTYAILIAVTALTIRPFLYMISISVRPDFSFMYFPLSLIPEEVGWNNYQLLFRHSLIERWILNSAVIAVSITLLQLFTCSMAGYAFARGDFPGRDTIFWIFMGTLMIPSTVIIVPMFILMSMLGWVDSYYALIVPASTSIFGTFLLRQNFKGVPKDYDDAAYIDGANRFDIYWRILLPLSRPALATLATLTFLAHWNDFLYPLIMTQSLEMRPLTVGLATMVVQQGQAGVQMAGATITFIPTFLFFFIMQRYVVRGITLSGVKG
ncbi:carbohydrate ABC transporter permease [Chloroflexi bacterium TSY]|nr:carbohydrate ABC transporter permease [Chloroflexi bacterium TSY]